MTLLDRLNEFSGAPQGERGSLLDRLSSFEETPAQPAPTPVERRFASPYTGYEDVSQVAPQGESEYIAPDSYKETLSRIQTKRPEMVREEQVAMANKIHQIYEKDDPEEAYMDVFSTDITDVLPSYDKLFDSPEEAEAALRPFAQLGAEFVGTGRGLASTASKAIAAGVSLFDKDASNKIKRFAERINKPAEYEKAIDESYREEMARMTRSGDAVGATMLGLEKGGLGVATGLLQLMMAGQLTGAAKFAPWAKGGKIAQMATNASRVAMWNFLSGRGNTTENLKNAGMTFAYLMTPALGPSQLAAKGGIAGSMMLDFALNTALSTFMSKAYPEAIAEAREMAAADGKPDAWLEYIFQTSASETLISDIAGVLGGKRGAYAERLAEDIGLRTGTEPVKQMDDESLGKYLKRLKDPATEKAIVAKTEAAEEKLIAEKAAEKEAADAEFEAKVVEATELINKYGELKGSSKALKELVGKDAYKEATERLKAAQGDADVLRESFPEGDEGARAFLEARLEKRQADIKAKEEAKAAKAAEKAAQKETKKETKEEQIARVSQRMEERAAEIKKTVAKASEETFKNNPTKRPSLESLKKDYGLQRVNAKEVQAEWQKRFDAQEKKATKITQKEADKVIEENREKLDKLNERLTKLNASKAEEDPGSKAYKLITNQIKKVEKEVSSITSRLTGEKVEGEKSFDRPSSFDPYIDGGVITQKQYAEAVKSVKDTGAKASGASFYRKVANELNLKKDIQLEKAVPRSVSAEEATTTRAEFSDLNDKLDSLVKVTDRTLSTYEKSLIRNQLATEWQDRIEALPTTAQREVEFKKLVNDVTLKDVQTILSGTKFQKATDAPSAPVKKSTEQFRELVERGGGKFSEGKGDVVASAKIGDTTIELKAARDIKTTEGEKASGYVVTKDGKVEIYLSEKDGKITTVPHEVGHIGYELLTKAERSTLDKAFGKLKEEDLMAQVERAYTSRKALSTKVRNALTKLVRIARSVSNAIFGTDFNTKATPEEILRDLGDGTMLSRLRESAAEAGNVKYQLTKEEKAVRKEERKKLEERTANTILKETKAKPIPEVVRAATGIERTKQRVSEILTNIYKGSTLIDGISKTLGKEHDSDVQVASSVKADNYIKWHDKAASLMPLFKSLNPEGKFRFKTDSGKVVEMTNDQRLNLMMLYRSANFGERAVEGKSRNVAKAILGGTVLERSFGRKSAVVKFTEKDLDRMYASSSAQMKKAIEQISALKTEIGDSIAAEYKNHTGDNLKRREYYTQVARDIAFSKGALSEAEARLAQKGLTSMLDPKNKGMLKKLGKSNAPVIIRSEMASLDAHIKDAAEYVGYNPLVRKLKAQYQNASVSDAITSTKGSAFKNEIDSYIDSIGGQIDTRLDPMQKVYRALLGNATVVRLASPFVWAKQPMSVFNYVSEFGADALAFSKVIDKKLVNRVLEDSPYMRSRWINKSFDVFLDETGQQRGAYLYGKKTARSLSREAVKKAMSKGDKLAISKGIMMAKYDVDKTWKAPKDDAYYKEIARRADIATQRTQVATETLHRSGLSRDPNVWKRSLSYLYGAREVNFNIIARAAGNYRNDPSLKNAGTAFRDMAAVMVAQAAAIAAINAGRRALTGDDEVDWSKEMIEGIAESNIGNIPSASLWLEPLKNSALGKGSFKGGGPLSSIPGNMTRFFGSVKAYYKFDKASKDMSKTHSQRRSAARRKELSFASATKSAVNFGSELFGIPVNQLHKLRKVPSNLGLVDNNKSRN